MRISASKPVSPIAAPRRIEVDLSEIGIDEVFAFERAPFIEAVKVGDLADEIVERHPDFGRSFALGLASLAICHRAPAFEDDFGNVQAPVAAYCQMAADWGEAFAPVFLKLSEAFRDAFGADYDLKSAVDRQKKGSSGAVSEPSAPPASSS